MVMKTKRIAVYDTAPEDCHITAEAVRECFDRAGVRAVVSEFTESAAFVYDFRDNHCDVMFVGISSMLDLETARGVRGLDENCPMLLVSSITEYALEGYRVNALDYILKPMTLQRTREALGRAVPQFGI